jgi:hypothetical protein
MIRVSAVIRVPLTKIEVTFSRNSGKLHRNLFNVIEFRSKQARFIVTNDYIYNHSHHFGKKKIELEQQDSSILCFSPESYELSVLVGLLAYLTFNSFPSCKGQWRGC